MLSWSFLRICKSIDGATTSSTLAGGGEEEAVLTSPGARESDAAITEFALSHAQALILGPLRYA